VSQQLIHLDSRKPLARIATFAVLLLALVCAFFVVRWYIGNTLADYFDPGTNGAEVARLAVSFGPDDPLTHWRLGEFIEKQMPPDQIGSAVAEYERAVSLSPNDYRFWMALGRGLEQAGDSQRAEKALRQALALAPAYGYPRWYLGNLLLRGERYDEAFAELQKAGDSNPELRPQLFNLAWEVYKNDTRGLSSAAGKTPEARAQFGAYLVGRGRIEDGIGLWGTLAPNEKRENLDSAKSIIGALVTAQRFHEAVAIWNDIAPNENYRASVGQLSDGSFEFGIGQASGAIFGWQVQSQTQAQVGMDPNIAHSGSRGLRLVFQVRSKLTALNVSQLVAVAPNTSYTLEYYLKTNKLETAATPFIAIIDTKNGYTIGSSPPAPTGTNDWQRVAVTFKTSPDTQAIYLKILPTSCGANVVCPIFGSIWYDDFTLKIGS
jgi:tetratricopeptide (TPR) repeat protein